MSDINPIVTRGYGEDSLIITQGYGYIEVIVVEPIEPPIRRPPRPRIIRVPKEFLFDLVRLGIVRPYEKVEKLVPLDIMWKDKKELTLKERNLVKQYEKGIGLVPLALTKAIEIKVLLRELNIALPHEVQAVLDELSATAKLEKSFSLRDLDIIKKDRTLYQIATLNFIKEIKKEIEAQIPNIHALKKMEQLKVMRLINLLDQLDKVDIDEDD